MIWPAGYIPTVGTGVSNALEHGNKIRISPHLGRMPWGDP